MDRWRPAGLRQSVQSRERGAPRRMRGGAARSNLDKFAQAGGTPAVHIATEITSQTDWASVCVVAYSRG